jgi:putative ABC transport system permease protein
MIMGIWETVLSRFVGASMAAEMLGDLAERYGHSVHFHATAAMLAIEVASRSFGRVASRSLSSRFGLCGAAGDARQTLRGLCRTPASSAVVVVMLAAGLGVNGAIFSLVYGVLFQPLPFRDPARVVLVEGVHGAMLPAMYSISIDDFRDLTAAQRTFDALGLAGYWTFNLTDVTEPQRILGARVTGRFFETLGTVPVIGRWITEGDDRPDSTGPEVAVISHGFWQREFGGRPDAIGRTLLLNGVKTTVVGVMPARFHAPGDDVELWAPLRDAIQGAPRNARFLTAFGRLKRETPLAQAGEDLNAIAATLERQFPETNKDWRIEIVPALTALTSTVRTHLLLLFAAVVIVLLVVAANAAGLLASRRAARGREFALRAALGAGRFRLMRLSVFESLWLAMAGLALGLLLASPCLAVLRASAPASLPRVSEVALNWTVVVACTAAMVSIAVACGLGSVRSRRFTHLLGALAAARSSLEGRERRLGRAGFVVAQVALAFVLLTGAGLLARSFIRVLAVDPGFTPNRLITMRVFLGPPRYPTIASQVAYADGALERLRALPGITMATAVSQAPFDLQGSGTSLPTIVDGRTDSIGDRPTALYRAVAPGYFSSMGVRLREGREFSIDDRPNSPPVVVINESMARRWWSGRSPLGARLIWPEVEGSPTLTIVGVVDNVATDGLEQHEADAIYGPYAQRTLAYVRGLTFIVRTDAEPGSRASDIRGALHAVDADQPAYAMETMHTIIGRSLAERRFVLLLMLSFASLTLLVAVLGVYSTLAQLVHQRRREIGVRLAIGATRRQVFHTVAGQGSRIIALGLATGAVCSLVLSNVVEHLLFGVAPDDPWTYGGISVLLAIVGAAACTLPAVRASRVDPAQTLRGE